MLRRSQLCCSALLVCLLNPTTLLPQEGCPVPEFTLPEDAPNFISERQEVDLGNAVAEQIQSVYTVIDDDINDYLRAIGKRLLAQLPRSGLQIEFHLVSFPQVNAFSLPGGRIYVARKLVAATRSEDELAGVLAHEIGHVITRHAAIDMSHLFSKVLGITSLGDSKDVYTKFNQLLDNLARNPRALKDISRSEDDEQVTADRVSLYLMKRAGYDPQAYIQFWDRVAEVGGKTGNVLGDLFGRTKPEQKRLREMRRLIDQLPAACTGPRPEIKAADYEEWKSAVGAYSGLGHRESLPPAEWKKALNPKLRGNIQHMRFSQDGKHLLAQDSASIFVLSHKPFEFLFRIDAENALPAQFTPDSQAIVFHSPDLRVEKWSIAEERRIDLHEMTVGQNCISVKLSPDGRHLACLDLEFKLTMFNVADGLQVFQKKFSPPRFLFVLRFSLLNDRFGQLEFTPDGRYFVGRAFQENEYVAYDFTAGKLFNLPKEIRSRLHWDFGFLSDSRFFGLAGTKGENSAVVSFPSGEALRKFDLVAANVDAVTHGDFLILRPVKDFPIGVLDINAGKMILGIKQDSIDLYDRSFASEQIDGVLSLLNADDAAVIGQARLPQSPLLRPRALSLSADMNWLAVSEKSRGAIWNLKKNERVFLSRNFDGAEFIYDNTLLVDLPKSGDEKRKLVRMDPAGLSLVSSRTIEEERAVTHDGLYLLEYRQEAGKGKEAPNTILAVQSALTGQDLWTRAYPTDFPSFTNFNSDEDRAVFVWSTSSEFVKEESKSNTELKKRIESSKERQGDYYIQVLQASTGAIRDTVYVKTGRGSFRLHWAEIAGDYLALYDNQNRLLVYSISSGERLGQIFGVNGSLSPANSLLAAENKSGVLTIYSLPSMEERNKLVFGHRLVYMRFSKDGRRLFALTSDQVAYLFNTEEILTR